MSVTQRFQSQAADFYETGYKNWSYGMNVSILEVNMLINSSTLAISVLINVKLGFVSVNGPTEIYYLDALYKYCILSDLVKKP